MFAAGTTFSQVRSRAENPATQTCRGPSRCRLEWSDCQCMSLPSFPSYATISAAAILTCTASEKSFTNWAYAAGRFREIAIELSLDHAYGNKIHRAYRDDQLIEERRELLQA